MCTVSTPKPVKASDAPKKPTQVLRNPYLDGIDPATRAKQLGVGSFRIDRVSNSTARGASGSARIARSTPTTGASPAVMSLALNRSV